MGVKYWRGERSRVQSKDCCLFSELVQADTMEEVFPEPRPLPSGPVLDIPRVGSTSAAAMPPVSAVHIEL